jgi:hypothetical protein
MQSSLELRLRQKESRMPQRKAFSEVSTRVTDHSGFQPLFIVVEPRHRLPEVTHGGKLLPLMIARFNR